MNILILIIFGIVILFIIVLAIRNEYTFAFLTALNHLIHDELIRILDSYDNEKIHFTSEEQQKYECFSKKAHDILDRLSYYKIVFSYKPIRVKYWLSKEDIKFIKELTEYKKSA